MSRIHGLTLSLLSAALLASACANPRASTIEHPPARPHQPAAAASEKAAPPAPAPAPAPSQKAEPELAEEAWRKTRPTPPAPSEPKVPKFQQASLENGLTILVSERHELPIVGLSIAIKAGTAAEPKGKAGVAELTYDMLLEGTGKLDALALDRAFGELGVTPRVSTGGDGAMVSAQPLTRNADAVLKLMAETVLRPRFEKTDFERLKKLRRESLVNAYSNPGFLASEAFAAVVYGEDHPYGHLAAGTPRSIESLTLADVKNFYKANVGPKTAALIATGDVTMEQAKQWAEKYFGAWKGSAKVLPAPPPPKTGARQHVVLVPKPGLNQTTVLMGRPGIAANHGDEAELELASSVFGGFFSSRLNMNLRERLGYTYGASAGASARRGVGSVSARSPVKATVTAPAIGEFLKELQELKTKPITEAELNAAREGLVRALPGSFETVGSLTGTVANLWFEDRPLDHYQRYLEDLQTSDAKEVQSVAEKYFAADQLQLILVGDPEVIQKAVAELKLGEVKTRTPPQLKR